MGRVAVRFLAWLDDSRLTTIGLRQHSAHLENNGDIDAQANKSEEHDLLTAFPQWLNNVWALIPEVKNERAARAREDRDETPQYQQCAKTSW
jgi:hypothetical protein